MSLVLDTSILLDIERKDKNTIDWLKAFVEFFPAPGAITFMTYFEFVYGVRKRSPKNKEKALAFVDKFHLLEPGKRTALIISDLRQKYEEKGISFTLADLMIAAQTIENNMVLATKDKQFDHISELKKIIL